MKQYFLFQPGQYTLTYTVDDTIASQVIIIDNQCRGCLGCYSCDTFARYRPIPDSVMEIKKLSGDWLLVGLSLLIMMSLVGKKHV